MNTETLHTKTDKHLVPQLRFREFVDEWKEILLDDFAVRGSGHTPSKSHPEYYNGNIYWISLKDSKRLDNGYIEKTETKITQKGIDNSSAVLHPPGTVLLSRDAGIGKSAVMRYAMAVSQHFIVWKAIENKSSNWFLYNWLQIMKPRFERIAIGSTIKTIGLPYFKKLKIIVPAFYEQQKIAHFLTTVDTKIQQLTKKKALLERYKKGVMQQLFSQQLRFKQDDSSDYPDWEEKKLGEIFKISAGGDVKKENVSPEKQGKFIYPIFANSEKRKGLYGYSDLYKIDEECITVTGRGSLGVANARFNKFYPIVRLLVLKPIKKSSVVFFENLINTMRIYNESTGVPQLTSPQLATYKTKLPCFEEQQKIANYLSALDTKIESVAQQIEKTQEFKKGLLQQMFV